MAKKKKAKWDGLNESDLFRIKAKLREVWFWSYSRKLCIDRATDKAGFGHCEKCKKKVPKVYPDHIEAIGAPGPELIARMFVKSDCLQALCKACHSAKTRADNLKERDFF